MVDLENLDIKTVNHKKDGQLKTARRLYEADSLLNWVERWSFYDRTPSFFISIDNGGSAHKVNYEGNEVWAYVAGATMRDIAVDHIGNSYLSCTDETARKLDGNGTLLWSFDLYNEGRGMAVDKDGYVYVATRLEAMHKIDPNGNEIWMVQRWQEGDDWFRNEARGVDVGSDGFIYLSTYGSSTSRGKVHKLDSNGNLVWSYDDSDVTRWRRVAVDKDGNVHATAYDHNRVYKINAAGNTVWTYNQGSTTSGIAVDYDGSVYSGSLNNELHKLDSNGNHIWTYDHIGTVIRIEVDPNNYVYAVGGGEGHKIDSGGNKVWGFAGLSNFGAAVYPGRVGAFYSVW